MWVWVVIGGAVALSFLLYFYIVVSEWWRERSPLWLRQSVGLVAVRIEQNLALAEVDDEYQSAQEALSEIKDNGQGVPGRSSVQHEGCRSAT